MKVNVKRRWLTEKEMGAAPICKTVSPHHFGEVKGSGCPFSFCVLRAWCIFRFQTKGFAERKHLRRSWLARQKHELRIDMIALGGVAGGTGSDKANQLIRGFVADVF